MQQQIDIVYQMDQLLHKELFRQREEGSLHAPYEHELLVLECVRRGNCKELEQVNKLPPPQGRIGTMSRNPLRQRIYELITWATMVTRFALEGGLDIETAYTLSDLYIQKADTMQSLEKLHQLQLAMTWDFAHRVAKVRAKGYSKPVSRTIEYILSHLHSSIRLQQLADACKLTPQYLCKVFEAETGSTIGEFIRTERVEEACVLLACSDMAGAEIGTYVGFCGQSHFIQTFKRQKGCTPSQYRKACFRKQWNKDRIDFVSDCSDR